MEEALQRLLKEQATDSGYRDILSDLEEVRAVQLKANGKSWLIHNELPRAASQLFKAVGLRTHAYVQLVS